MDEYVGLYAPLFLKKLMRLLNTYLSGPETTRSHITLSCSGNSSATVRLSSRIGSHTNANCEIVCP